jgi:hypothetical protein
MALTATQSAVVGIEPYQVGPYIKLKCTVSYLNPSFTEVDDVLTLQPQGLWNGLAPLINKLISGSFAGWLIGGQGPQPPMDLSRVAGGVLPEQSMLFAPPPSVDWPFSRRTPVQHLVDAGELDESGAPVPAGTAVPVRPPSYSSPYATTPTETEDDVNRAALAASPGS